MYILFPKSRVLANLVKKLFHGDQSVLPSKFTFTSYIAKCFLSKKVLKTTVVDETNRFLKINKTLLSCLSSS